jgi:hypothetical protein
VRYSRRAAQNSLAQPGDVPQGNERPDYLVLVNERYTPARCSTSLTMPNSVSANTAVNKMPSTTK